MPSPSTAIGSLAGLRELASLKPAFTKDGTITAANASSINDGASALVLASEAAVKKHNLKPIAKIVGYAGAAQEPQWFTTAPAKAMDGVLQKLGLTPNGIDLVEINEAFAVVAMVSAQLSKIDLSKVNVRGGAVALGHPIGASGARITTTLLHALQHANKKRGLAREDERARAVVDRRCVRGGDRAVLAEGGL